MLCFRFFTNLDIATSYWTVPRYLDEALQTELNRSKYACFRSPGAFGSKDKAQEMDQSTGGGISEETL